MIRKVGSESKFVYEKPFPTKCSLNSLLNFLYIQILTANYKIKVLCISSKFRMPNIEIFTVDNAAKVFILQSEAIRPKLIIVIREKPQPTRTNIDRRIHWKCVSSKTRTYLPTFNVISYQDLNNTLDVMGGGRGVVVSRRKPAENFSYFLRSFWRNLLNIHFRASRQ